MLFCRLGLGWGHPVDLGLTQEKFSNFLETHLFDKGIPLAGFFESRAHGQGFAPLGLSALFESCLDVLGGGLDIFLRADCIEQQVALHAQMGVALNGQPILFTRLTAQLPRQATSRIHEAQVAVHEITLDLGLKAWRDLELVGIGELLDDGIEGSILFFSLDALAAHLFGGLAQFCQALVAKVLGKIFVELGHAELFHCFHVDGVLDLGAVGRLDVEFELVARFLAHEGLADLIGHWRIAVSMDKDVRPLVNGLAFGVDRLEVNHDPVGGFSRPIDFLKESVAVAQRLKLAVHEIGRHDNILNLHRDIRIALWIDLRLDFDFNLQACGLPRLASDLEDSRRAVEGGLTRLSIVAKNGWYHFFRQTLLGFAHEPALEELQRGFSFAETFQSHVALEFPEELFEALIPGSSIDLDHKQTAGLGQRLLANDRMGDGFFLLLADAARRFFKNALFCRFSGALFHLVFVFGHLVTDLQRWGEQLARHDCCRSVTACVPLGKRHPCESRKMQRSALARRASRPKGNRLRKYNRRLKIHSGEIARAVTGPPPKLTVGRGVRHLGPPGEVILVALEPLLADARETVMSSYDTPQPPVRKNESVELCVRDLAFGGRGVARMGNFVIFVEGALPAERVLARIVRVKNDYAEARVETIIEPSPARMEPPCALFGRCGGCKLQNLAYEEQLHQKEKQIREIFEHLAGIALPEVRPIIPSPNQWRYRNKMEMAFGSDPDGRLLIGFHTPGDFRHVLDVPECHIQPPLFDAIVEFLRTELENMRRAAPERFTAYDPVSHEGFFRHLVMRHSQATGEVLVAILTHEGKWPEFRALASSFLERFPQCQGLTWGINRGVSDVARMEEKREQFGRGWIEEQLGERIYRISTFSFFQTNSAGAKLLYDTVRELAQLDGTQRVLDAYCGTGSIGLYLADQAREVIGVEVVREAVWDARHNAQRNGLTNCTFLAGEMRDVLPTLATTLGRHFDRIIVDPPRGGMDKRSLRLLIGLEAPLIVYVSCNPTTLARDAATLAAAGYAPEVAQPVDLFPHTHHVECVVKFRRKVTS